MAFAPGLLQGRRALVTGGGTGLGRSIARRFVELGASLAICGRRGVVLEATAEAFRAEIPGADVTTHVCDIRDPAAVEAMLDDVWRAAPPDILVNNAAANFLAQTHKLSGRAVDAVLGTTLHGAAYCTIGCGRRWIEARQPGVVLSILTLSALQGGAFTAPSAMAKAGLLAMTQSLAVEWGPHGIRLVAIAPGTFPTEAAVARLRPGGVDHSGVPLRRAGKHDELTDLAAFLVSDHAGYITGEWVVADGGRRLLSGARAGAQEMLDWTDEQWAQQRARTPAR
ncbi:SDR family oxidoreductase [Roseomonas terrae]|jgi:NAD(P)-dependent dehydrogenase (short-subunit alcohol dehydrogenase family)|uniref:Peroxisomal trans-2-enoyl-CoA reductase n=1 Tax=Neoroseomonas terrae TaxID=424799 RepID=A0ABS5EB05_9PROT|nr:SDR family oxidoreductase [Neoroseomonas terrae]MBR0648201.1 SDR family oxidoreductase [Neoroseomonas terrae]